MCGILKQKNYGLYHKVGYVIRDFNCTSSTICDQPEKCKCCAKISGFRFQEAANYK